MFTATLFTIAKTMEAAKMSINRGLDKEDVIYIYIYIYIYMDMDISHKKGMK